MQQQAALGPAVVVGPDCMAAVARPAASLPASILLAGAALTATSTRFIFVFGVVKKITLLYTLLKKPYNLSSAIQNCAFPYERMYYKFDLTSMND